MLLHAGNERGAAIGPLGRVARALVGLALVALAALDADTGWLDAAFGLAVAPAAAVGAFALRARRMPGRLVAIGPAAACGTVAVGVVLITIEPTSSAALLFVGASMLVAAAARNRGCEMTAISNVVLRRDDQLGCALFAPVDGFEGRVRAPDAATPRSGA